MPLPLRDLRVYPTPSHRRSRSSTRAEQHRAFSRADGSAAGGPIGAPITKGGLRVFHQSFTHKLITGAPGTAPVPLPPCLDKATGLCRPSYPPAGCVLLKAELRGQFKGCWGQGTSTRTSRRRHPDPPQGRTRFYHPSRGQRSADQAFKGSWIVRLVLFAGSDGIFKRRFLPCF